VLESEGRVGEGETEGEGQGEGEWKAGNETADEMLQEVEDKGDNLRTGTGLQNFGLLTFLIKLC
jgi:hypothetical protein